MKSTAPLVRVEVEYHRHRMATASSHSQPHSRSSDSIAHCGALRGLSPLALNALNRCLFALALPVDFRIGRIESPSEPHGSDPMDGPNERRVRGPRLQIRGRAGASGGVTSALAAWAGSGASPLHAAQGPGRVPLAAVSPLGNASRQCLSSSRHRQHRGCAVIGRAPRRVRQRRALDGESQPAPPAPQPPWRALCSASAWP